MSELKAGFSRVNINPTLGIAVSGYYVPRFASGILDDLYANCLTVEKDGTTVALISIDNVGINKDVLAEYGAYIEARSGVSAENLFFHCTHTHTGPCTVHNPEFACDDAPIDQYREFLKQRLGDAVVLALQTMRPARLGFAVGYAPDRVSYIRRYRMKDGSTWTCPPIESPEIDHPIGTLDRRVNVLRIDREGADSVVILNYGLHADTLNIDQISPDWPGWMARTFEAAVPDSKVMFFAGAEGDVGSTHVFPEGGDMNDTEISFDNEMKSPGMCRFVGRAMAGTILQVYDKVEYVDVDDIRILKTMVEVPANKPAPEDLPRAHEYKRLHEADRDDLIPYTAMELTTVVAEALRMCRLENGPDTFTLPMTGLKLGPVALIGIPGEPFTDIGRTLQDTAEGWKCVLPCCNANGYEGYFPMKSAFDEGGYEARSSVYKGGVAESLIAGGQRLLAELKS